MSCTTSNTATGGFRKAAIAGCGLAALIAGKSLGQSLEYELRTLGTLGGDNSVALGMNDFGMVVGWAETAPPECERHAFLWQGGVMTDLGTLGGTWSEARSINNNGVIVGVSEMPDGRTHGFYFADGRMSDLNLVLDPDYRVDLYQAVATEGGTCYSSFTEFIDAAAINDDGSIIGCGYLLGKPGVHGYILHRVGGFGPGFLPMFDYWPLGELPGADSCIPGDLNYLDQVVGLSGYEAFIWDGEMHHLETLSIPSLVMKSKANAINNAGTVVGFADAGAKRTAAMWRGMRRINLGYRGWITEALDINSLDQVVGRAEGLAAVAMLWDGARAVDLNTITAVPVSAPGYEPDNFHWASLVEASAINDSGMIAGYGMGIDDRYRAYLLLPLGTPADFKP